MTHITHQSHITSRRQAAWDSEVARKESRLMIVNWIAQLSVTLFIVACAIYALITDDGPNSFVRVTVLMALGLLGVIGTEMIVEWVRWRVTARLGARPGAGDDDFARRHGIGVAEIDHRLYTATVNGWFLHIGCIRDDVGDGIERLNLVIEEAHYGDGLRREVTVDVKAGATAHDIAVTLRGVLVELVRTTDWLNEPPAEDHYRL